MLRPGQWPCAKVLRVYTMNRGCLEDFKKHGFETRSEFRNYSFLYKGKTYDGRINREEWHKKVDELLPEWLEAVSGYQGGVD